MTEAQTKDKEETEVALKLYTLAVEMADRISARRAGANSFFLTVQTGLAALFGVLAVRSGTDVAPDRFILTLAVCAGLVLAAAWWLVLRGYRKLNEAKFAVITDIERSYFKLTPFAAEWSALTRNDTLLKGWRASLKRFPDRYLELGVVERTVPAAFVVLYAALALHLSGHW